MVTKKSSKKYVIVRTYSAGVFAGFLEGRKGQEVILSQAIRLWRWAGAASLSQLAAEGVKLPAECKFGMPISRVDLLQAIEILEVTKTAQSNIVGVPSWRV